MRRGCEVDNRLARQIDDLLQAGFIGLVHGGVVSDVRSLIYIDAWKYVLVHLLAGRIVTFTCSSKRLT